MRLLLLLAFLLYPDPCCALRYMECHMENRLKGLSDS